MTVAGLVLAAGAGRRFGRPKALVEVAGERLVDRAVARLREGGCAYVVVVSGAAPVSSVDAVVVDNPQWSTGMGSSLRVGLAAVEADAAVVIPVDMPWLGAQAVARVIAAFSDGGTVVTATYAGQRRHPVLLARAHFAEVSRLATGDVGARPFLRAHPELVIEVPCDDTGSPADIDTPADLDQPGLPADLDQPDTSADLDQPTPPSGDRRPPAR